MSEKDTNALYINSQLINLAPTPVKQKGDIKIQMHNVTNGRKTNWLDLTPAQVSAIEQILEKG